MRKKPSRQKLMGNSGKLESTFSGLIPFLIS